MKWQRNYLHKLLFSIQTCQFIHVEKLHILILIKLEINRKINI